MTALSMIPSPNVTTCCLRRDHRDQAPGRKYDDGNNGNNEDDEDDEDDDEGDTGGVDGENARPARPAAACADCISRRASFGWTPKPRESTRSFSAAATSFIVSSLPLPSPPLSQSPTPSYSS